MAKVYLGADHAGFKLKEHLKSYLIKEGYKVEDKGNLEYEKKDDYPDFAFAVGQAVIKNKNSRGIVVCHNGVGICVAVNKVKGARCGLAFNARMAGEMVNDAFVNVISLGQADVKPKEAEKIVKAFLTAKTSAEPRHKRRVNKIKKFEK